MSTLLATWVNEMHSDLLQKIVSVHNAVAKPAKPAVPNSKSTIKSLTEASYTDAVTANINTLVKDAIIEQLEIDVSNTILVV